MSEKKKLQVFVSSTYQDLRAERQAAVEAILSAGHIPAGMELFAAGDQSQMQVIQRWIDESDVFLLILGGRYGSIEPESQKSYIHLEYEYALSSDKPVFAVVIDEKHLEKKIKSLGSRAVDDRSKLAAFRQLVESRLVKYWNDPRDIKLAIHETMADFSRRSDLVGWLPGDQTVNAAPLAEELARLAKENSELREQVSSLSGRREDYNGLLFDELVALLWREGFVVTDSADEFDVVIGSRVQGLADRAKVSPPRLLHGLWAVHEFIIPTCLVPWSQQNLREILQRLQYYGIVEYIDDGSYENGGDTFRITPAGRNFVLRFMVQRKRILRRGGPDTSVTVP